MSLKHACANASTPWEGAHVQCCIVRQEPEAREFQGKTKDSYSTKGNLVIKLLLMTFIFFVDQWLPKPSSESFLL